VADILIIDSPSQASQKAQDEELRLIREYPDQSSVAVQIPAGLAARMDAYLEQLQADHPSWVGRSRDELIADMVRHSLMTRVGLGAYLKREQFLKTRAA
jgi:hypothetical protein